MFGLISLSLIVRCTLLRFRLRAFVAAPRSERIIDAVTVNRLLTNYTTAENSTGKQALKLIDVRGPESYSEAGISPLLSIFTSFSLTSQLATVREWRI